MIAKAKNIYGKNKGWLMKKVTKVNIGNCYYNYIRYGLITYFISSDDFNLGDYIHFVDQDGLDINKDAKNLFEVIHIEDNHVGILKPYKIVSIQRICKSGE